MKFRAPPHIYWRLPLAVLTMLLFLNSCRFAAMSPFQAVDYKDVARSVAAPTLVESRVRPSTTISGKRSLTLDDCKNIALRNNLEIQSSIQDQITKREQRESQRTQILPHLSFNSELSERDNYRWAYGELLGSEGIGPSTLVQFQQHTAQLTPAQRRIISELGFDPSQPYFWATGHERSTWRYSLELRWSPNDAATAYFKTRTKSNQYMAAHWERIRIAQQLLGRLEGAFFRALGHQTSVHMAIQLERIRGEVAGRTKELIDRKITTIEDYQNAMLKYIRARKILVQTRSELERQRNQLASIMAISSAKDIAGGFVLDAELTESLSRPQMFELELYAARNRPEIYKNALEYLNAVNEVKTTKLKYVPQVTGFHRYSYDKDKYLQESNWKEVGVNVKADVFDWVGNINGLRAAESNREKVQKDIAATVVNVTSEAHDAGLKYFQALELLTNAKESLKMSEKVLDVIRKRRAAGTLDKLKEDDALASVLESQIERSGVLAEARACLGELYAAMGINYIEPEPKD